MDHTQDSYIHYQSYMLRLWRDEVGNVRQATLQSTATHYTYHFANLEALLAFLASPSGNSTDDEWINE